MRIKDIWKLCTGESSRDRGYVSTKVDNLEWICFSPARKLKDLARNLRLERGWAARFQELTQPDTWLKATIDTAHATGFRIVFAGYGTGAIMARKAWERYGTPNDRCVLLGSPRPSRKPAPGPARIGIVECQYGQDWATDFPWWYKPSIFDDLQWSMSMRFGLVAGFFDHWGYRHWDKRVDWSVIEALSVDSDQKRDHTLP